jgi:hypothetical protein
MTTERDDRYERLLRWYPRAWREARGAVFVDTLREQSEHEGRDRPSRGESAAALINGLGTRLDARLASRSALAGIALLVVVQTLAGALSEALAAGGPVERLPDGVYITCVAVTGALVLVGIVAIARTYGVLSPARAVLVLALAWASLTLGDLGEYAWGLGFSQADDNQASTGFAAASGPLLGAAMLVGMACAWLSLAGVLGRTRLGRLTRLGLALVAAAAIMSVAVVTVFVQATWVSLALTVMALSLRSLGAFRGPAALTDPQAAAPRSLVRVLAGVSFGIGLFGVIYSATGSTWSASAGDGGAATSQGGVILLAGSLPLVAALGVLAAQRGQRRLQFWGPLILMCLVIATLTIAFFTQGSLMVLPLLIGGSAAAGLAIAWWASSRLAGTRGDRWVAGASIIAACVASYVTLPTLGTLATLLLAAVLAIRGDLRLRRTRTPDPASAPLAGA